VNLQQAARGDVSFRYKKNATSLSKEKGFYIERSRRKVTKLFKALPPAPLLGSREPKRDIGEGFINGLTTFT
jgi:hypothetical protein